MGLTGIAGKSFAGSLMGNYLANPYTQNRFGNAIVNGGGHLFKGTLAAFAANGGIDLFNGAVQLASNTNPERNDRALLTA